MQNETNGARRKLVLNEDAVKELEVSESQAVGESAEVPTPQPPGYDAPTPEWYWRA